MQKTTNDYDRVFKTMKMKHRRLFISVINEIFGKQYSRDVPIEVLPSEGFLTRQETKNGSEKIEERDSDFLIRIEDTVFLLECQSYEDGSMAIRIAEYAFIAARQSAVWRNGYAVMTMPHFSVIYVKQTNGTPRQTKIVFIFPDGQSVEYKADNILLKDYSKEEMIEKRLFPYIPFYVTRYEKELMAKDADLTPVIRDMEYFGEQIIGLQEEGELTGEEKIDLIGFINTIIVHITNGNQNEERLVKVMDGVIMETLSERLRREGKAQEIIVLYEELDKSKEDTILKLQEHLDISRDRAMEYYVNFKK